MNNPNSELGNWAEYQRLILSEIERLSKTLVDLEKKIQEINIHQEILKERIAIRSIAFGAVAGTIPVLIYIVVHMLTK